MNLFKIKAIKYSYIILLLLAHCYASAQNIVTIDKSEIDIQKLSYQQLKPVQKASKNGIENDSLIKKISMSKDRQYISIVDESNDYYYSNLAQTRKTKSASALNIYEIDGTKLFSKTYDKYKIHNVSIENDGNLVFVNLNSCKGFDDCEFLLQIFNKKGELMLQQSNASTKPTMAINPISPIYYGFVNNTESNNDEKKTISLVSYDHNENKVLWSKEYFGQRFGVSDISQNGDTILVLRDNQIVCFDKYGKEFFSKDVKQRPGRFSLSSDGKYILNIIDPEKAVLINTVNNEILFEEERFKTQFGELRFINGGFVKGSESIYYLCYWFKRGETIFWFYNIQNQIIDEISVKDLTVYQNDKLDISYDQNRIRIYSAGILQYESETKW